ncbi:MAG: NAD(P)-binding domain-containing protein, partial [Anaerolineaceae bacterium]|nr:NAD(P)-binding domain-containing protein [Anaerolineaceae bacterium]
MKKSPLIAVVGPGVMGEAIIAGLLRNEVTHPANIHICGPELDRNEELRQQYGVQPFADNVPAVAQADLVILSVKPQVIKPVVAGLKNQIPRQALVLSIVAGTSIQSIGEGLNHAS